MTILAILGGVTCIVLATILVIGACMISSRISKAGHD